MDWNPLWLTFKLALITTAILFVISVPIAHSLAFNRKKWTPFLEALVSLPLVLPPTVLGFYLLLLFSPERGFGAFLSKTLSLDLVFSFEGLVFASVIYSLPFMIQPIKSGLMNLPTSYREAAVLMGKSRWSILRRVLLPSIKPSILTALVLSFAHTIGEFGVVLMIGGNIPGVSRVASIAIYDEVEKLNYDAAHIYSLVIALISFAVLVIAFTYNFKGQKRWWMG